MTDPYDSDIGRLQAAIARWLSDNGVPDPAIGANEIVQIVRGHQWRPIEALKPLKATADPTPGGPTAEYLERKAALAARVTDPEKTSTAPLIDPDCRDSKCTSCVGGPCEHACHDYADEGSA